MAVRVAPRTPGAMLQECSQQGVWETFIKCPQCLPGRWAREQASCPTVTGYAVRKMVSDDRNTRTHRPAARYTLENQGAPEARGSRYAKWRQKAGGSLGHLGSLVSKLHSETSRGTRNQETGTCCTVWEMSHLLLRHTSKSPMAKLTWGWPHGEFLQGVLPCHAGIPAPCELAWGFLSNAVYWLLDCRFVPTGASYRKQVERQQCCAVVT